MAQDEFKPSGPTKASQPDAGGANPRTTPVFGVVKDNIDPTRSGRLQVYISDFGGEEPDNRNNWISVSYMTPFYGSTVPDAGEAGFGKYTENPSSYGMWYAQPDIDTTVICIFVNGDVNYGFWIGCVPKPEALTMVPAIGSTENVVPNAKEAKSYGGATRLPVTNINPNNTGVADTDGFLTAPKPIHSYQAGIMTQQGVIRDPVRGTISSSSQRETPSRVGWGVSTPGRPIYTGGFTDEDLAKRLAQPNQSEPADSSLRVVARRGGHSIVMDDGDLAGRDQLIRLRTARGHQILMSDDSQTLMILHSNGQSYIELGKEGTVDVYSTNSINFRTQGDFNIHADRNVNIHAMKEFNVQAENLKIYSDKESTFRSLTNIRFNTLKNFSVKAEMAMSLESKAPASFASKSLTFLNGKMLMLNTGFSPFLPTAIKPITLLAHTDTLHDAEKGFSAAPGKLLSITSRAPAHAPWANAGQGVDVKVSLTASDNLPVPPRTNVAETVKSAIDNVSSLVKSKVGPESSTAIIVPETQAISSALDKNNTSAMLGAAATVASNYYPAAVKTGFQIDTATGIVKFGQFAMDPIQMVRAGILKPGAQHTIFQLAKNSASFGITLKSPGNPIEVSKIIPSSLFTGKYGITNIQQFITNPNAQAAGMISNFQIAQTALTIGRAIKGTETPEQLAGLIMAGATTSVEETLNAVSKGITDGANKVLQMVYSGSAAINLAQNIAGAFGGISKALSIFSGLGGGGITIGQLLDQRRGVVASAYLSVLSQFKPLQANVPQNLRTINNQQKAAIAQFNIGANIYFDGAAAKASISASGVINLPGGQGVINAVINKNADRLTGAINRIPGGSAVASLALQAFNSKVAGIGTFPDIPAFAGGLLNTAINSLAATLGGSFFPGALAQLQSLISAGSPGGLFKIQLPRVGFNTIKRGDLEFQLRSVFSDARIPIPNFTGQVEEAAIAAAEQQLDEIEQQEEITLRYQQALEAADLAKNEYYRVEQSAPPGDPVVDVYRDIWLARLNQAQSILAELEEF